jgi:hypothetical protein
MRLLRCRPRIRLRRRQRLSAAPKAASENATKTGENASEKKELPAVPSLNPSGRGDGVREIGLLRQRSRPGHTHLAP